MIFQHQTAVLLLFIFFSSPKALETIKVPCDDSLSQTTVNKTTRIDDADETNARLRPQTLLEHISAYLPSAKDFFQIAFFIIIGFFTIKSYSLAQRALMDPFRNILATKLENTLEDIQTLFIQKTNNELRLDAHLWKVEFVNISKVNDLYSYFFFSYDLNQRGVLSDRPYNSNKCPSSRKINSEQDLELLFAEIELREAIIMDFSKFNNLSRKEKIQIWEKYKINYLELPESYHNYETKIRRLSATPFLPQKLRTLLSEYLAILHKNIDHIGEQLNKYTQELPEKYPKSYPIELFRPASIHLENDKYPLDDIGNKIIKYLDHYYWKLFKDFKSYLK